MIHAVSLVAGPFAAALFDAAPARAHGWHNAALTTSSLEEWLDDVQRVIPDILRRADETELRAGRGLEGLKPPGNLPNQPGNLPNQPGTSQNRPNTSQNQPGTGQNQPGSGQNQTGTGQNQTGTGQNQTGTGQKNKMGLLENKTGTLKNKAGTPQNKTGTLPKPPSGPQGKTGTLEDKTGTPENKKRTLENETGTPRNQMGMPAPQRGRQIISQLNPLQQQLLGRKAEDALEALAFMDPTNIYPEEFPRFDLSQIPRYRETAVKLLKLMGPVGTRAVISELRAELMGMGRSLKASDYRVNPGRYDALLNLLYEGVAVGEADPEDLDALRLATKGFKQPPLDALAKLVAEALAAGEATRDPLPKLAERISAPGDSDVRQVLLGVLGKRLADATVEEMAGLLGNDNDLVRQKATAELTRRGNQLSIAELIAMQAGLEREDAQTSRAFSEIFRKRLHQAKGEELLALANLKDASVRKMARSQLAKNLRGQDIASLLGMQQMFAGDPSARSVAAELASRDPTYAEVKDQLETIVGYLGSSDAETARAAERQTANAFQRAPIRECLRWLAVDDERLRKLIWKQIDGRIARAVPERKDGYRQVALQELANNDNELGIRLAAVELMERLNDSAAVQPLVDQLPLLPRELWPRCGEALRKLTRQDFGPRPGEGAAELEVALSKWRAWLAKQNK